MRDLIIKQTDNSPEIILSETLIEFCGNSYPENTFSFYEPVLKWLQTNLPKLNNNITINFKMEYFNSATTQILFDILDIICEHKQENMTINWYYKVDNENGLEDYEDYADEFPNLNIQAIAIEKVMS